MSEDKFDRNRYDVVSVSRSGSEKKANFVKDGFRMEKQEKTAGQFVRVFADLFLKQEASKSSYF